MPLSLQEIADDVGNQDNMIVISTLNCHVAIFRVFYFNKIDSSDQNV